MSEKFLDGDEISPVVEQHSREGMPKDVRTHL